MSGLTALAVSLSVSAYAQPTNSDLWIGFDKSENGFLLDEETGQTWMTGICLKPLEAATRTGNAWTSHTVELVSIGGVNAVLDQTFLLNVVEGAAEIRVESRGRGGVQSFPAIIDRNCAGSGLCAELIATQPTCNG